MLFGCVGGLNDSIGMSPSVVQNCRTGRDLDENDIV
jgi:hypothetical protein